ncbi:MAG: hypothetical protein J7L38_08120 [Thermoproteales archaeon]|nr:hypothetical protein [Thermoproteales archaeon]
MKESRESRRLGRFQVMALLQAARYYVLTGDLNKAKSFGLNRAIFYAWAKHYGKFKTSKQKKIGRPVPTQLPEKHDEKTMVYIGNEGVFVSPRGWFIIGDKEQLPQDFDRNIATRINSLFPFNEAWKVAVDYVKAFSKEVLLDQQKFFERVYKPVRDKFHVIIERKRKTSLENFLK